MKFCYIDESGTGDIDREPYAVMAGVITDVKRMYITKKDWSNLLKALSEIIGQQIIEIHTRDFYAGNGVWHGIKGDIRAKIISLIFQWLNERKHDIVYTAVDRKLFNAKIKNESHYIDIKRL